MSAVVSARGHDLAQKLRVRPTHAVRVWLDMHRPIPEEHSIYCLSDSAIVEISELLDEIDAEFERVSCDGGERTCCQCGPR